MGGQRRSFATGRLIRLNLSSPQVRSPRRSCPWSANRAACRRAVTPNPAPRSSTPRASAAPTPSAATHGVTPHRPRKHGPCRCDQQPYTGRQTFSRRESDRSGQLRAARRAERGPSTSRVGSRRGTGCCSPAALEVREQPRIANPSTRRWAGVRAPTETRTRRASASWPTSTDPSSASAPCTTGRCAKASLQQARRSRHSATDVGALSHLRAASRPLHRTARPGRPARPYAGPAAEKPTARSEISRPSSKHGRQRRAEPSDTPCRRRASLKPVSLVTHR